MPLETPNRTFNSLVTAIEIDYQSKNDALKVKICGLIIYDKV